MVWIYRFPRERNSFHWQGNALSWDGNKWFSFDFRFCSLEPFGKLYIQRHCETEFSCLILNLTKKIIMWPLSMGSNGDDDESKHNMYSYVYSPHENIYPYTFIHKKSLTRLTSFLLQFLWNSHHQKQKYLLFYIQTHTYSGIRSGYNYG